MEVNSLKIAKVFSSGGDIHYVLPLFQRDYTWEKSNFETLLTDIFAIYNEYVDENVLEHVMGSLVVIEDGNRNGVIPAFRLVDGQQRFTTISLLLCALRQLVRDFHMGIANKINRLLVNADEKVSGFRVIVWWPCTAIVWESGQKRGAQIRRWML